MNPPGALILSPRWSIATAEAEARYRQLTSKAKIGGRSPEDAA